MVLGWFDARQAKEFGVALAAYYRAQMPLDLKLNDKKFAARSQSTLRGLGTRIDEFKIKQGLNGYKKAQLCNQFKWALKDAGYDAEFVDKLTDWLVTRL